MQSDLREASIDVNESLLHFCRLSDFEGYDPFDGLNSSLFQRLPFGDRRIPRLVWLQAFKRLPINARRLAGIPKMRNAKGVALFILGCLEDFERSRNDDFIREARRLGDWLLSNPCDPDCWKYLCWGYNFDWQARAFFVPKGTPNVITTAYVSKAMFRLYRVTGEQTYADASVASARFIADKLLSEDDDGQFFSYVPRSSTFVHNASLWGAATVVRAGNLTGDEDLIQLGKTVANRSVDAQRNDGSWPYGTRGHHSFIDSFHTGYNLEALTEIAELLKIDDYVSCLRSGYSFYCNNFFLDDGTPKYYDKKVYPIDTHAAAQAIITALKVGRSSDDSLLADRVVAWMINNLYLKSKCRFRYQKHRFLSNNVCYMRWTQAWAYYALAYYNNPANARITC